MREILSVYVAGGSQLLAVFASLIARDNGDRASAVSNGELNCLRAQATRPTPHKNDIAVLDGVAVPPEQHPVGRRADQGRGGGLLPCQVWSLGHHLTWD